MAERRLAGPRPGLAAFTWPEGGEALPTRTGEARVGLVGSSGAAGGGVASTAGGDEAGGGDVGRVCTVCQMSADAGAGLGGGAGAGEGVVP